MLQIERRKVPMYFVILLLHLICFGGNGIWGLKRVECIYILGITLIFMYGSIYKRFSELKYLLPCLFLLFTLGTSSSPNYTTQYLLIYISGTALIFSRVCDDEFVSAFCSIVKIAGICNAIAIVLSPVVPELVSSVVSIVYYPLAPAGTLARTSADIARGVYYGFCGEKSIAAFIMALSLNIYICEYYLFEKLPKKKILACIILFVGLMMTGKRMEFLVPIIFFLLLFILVRRNSKILKFAGILLVATIALFILPIVFPQTELVLNRFLDSGADTIITGREIIWNYAFEMFENNPVIGAGYGSFNDYISSTNFVIPTGEKYWGYHVHSVYVQVLCECGIIGCIIWGFCYVGSYIRGLWSVYFRPERIGMNLYVSLAILSLIVWYGLSGNTIFEFSQLYCSFVGLAIFRKCELEW